MIAAKYPDQYRSPYQMVTFTDMPYWEAKENGRRINELLEELTHEPEP